MWFYFDSVEHQQLDGCNMSNLILLQEVSQSATCWCSDEFCSMFLCGDFCTDTFCDVFFFFMQWFWPKCMFVVSAQRLERLRKERQNQIKCKNIQWKETTSFQSGNVCLTLWKSIVGCFFSRCLSQFFHLFFPVDDPTSLFEKRDFKERQRTTGIKSTLSMRLEQCPQQLNNPFNEYSKFDGKVNHSTIFLNHFTLRTSFLMTD